MSASYLCLLAFLASFIAGRRSVWVGLAAALTVGYFYGIVRANVAETASHFTFDFACFGLYLALLTRHLTPLQKSKLRRLLPWFLCLLGWPTLMFFVPVQPVLVQLVGLRAHVFFLPFLLMGAMITDDEIYHLSLYIAVLSIATLGFALAEVVWGVPKFYPLSPVDAVIYGSNDIMLGSASDYRIPATFVQSAVYGGQMVGTMPLLAGLLLTERRRSWRRYLLIAAVIASAVGVFLSGSRTSAALLLAMAAMLMLSTNLLNGVPRYAWLGVVVVVAGLVAVSPRMQRFLTLQNTDYIAHRVHSSVNQGFLDLALTYPFGNGLGGGGTSLPYFLQDQMTDHVMMENEYARIMLEQGLPGLGLWLAFIIWLLTRPRPRRSERWYTARWLARMFCAVSFLMGAIGTGLLTSIPGTALLLFLSGWIAVPQSARIPARVPRKQPLAAPQAGVLQDA